jgi:XTP/dITP diphosphohydrolase
MNLIFASNNKGKIIEVQSLIPPEITVISMKDAGIDTDIAEPFDTFRDNAKAKAAYIKNITGQNCFAEDSGLIVPALNGEPGVFSARYAGEPSNDHNNNQKLLAEIQKLSDKRAYYKSVICLLLDDETHYFEGKCEGSITETPKGDGGFGYDPLFIPEGYEQTFGELSLEIKNTLSHRGNAMKLFTEFLHKHIAEEKRHVL